VRVEVRLFATLVDFLPSHGRDGVVQLEVPDGSTVADVASQLGIPANIARVVLVNGRDVEPGQRLAKQDIVTIFPPLAGGGPRVGGFAAGA
jgi:molybdopterin converting factor small subunit